MAWPAGPDELNGTGKPGRSRAVLQIFVYTLCDLTAQWFPGYIKKTCETMVRSVDTKPVLGTDIPNLASRDPYLLLEMLTRIR